MSIRASEANGALTSGLWVAALATLAVACFAAHAGSLDNGFIALDDDAYIGYAEEHSPIDPFREFAFHNYFPITLSTFALEHAFVRRAPFLYHLDNVILHVGVTLLVVAALAALRQPPIICLLVAAFFGLHPMRVESVAWVAERKDLLCTAFSLGALVFWARYAERRNEGRGGVLAYAGATALFGLALGSKSMAVVVPVLLLAVDWRLGRKLTGRVWLEKLPLFALSIGAGLLNLAAQRPGVELQSWNAALSMPERLVNAAEAVAFYVSRSVAPHGLSGYYQMGFATVSPADWALALAVLAGAGAWAWRHPAVRRDAILGAVLFAVPLALVLRIIAFGGLSRFNDRYMYLPSIGLFLLLTLPLRDVLRWPALHRVIALALCGLWLAGLAVASHRRSPVWASPDAYWMNVLEQVPNSSIALHMLGQQHFKRNETERALAYYKEAVHQTPGCGPCFFSIAVLHQQQGRPQDALRALDQAVAASPQNVRTLLSVAGFQMQLGAPETAAPLLEAALRIQPGLRIGRLQLGGIYTSLGRLEEAEAMFRGLLHVGPDDGAAHLGLGRVLLRDGRFGEALEHLTRAKQLGSEVDPRLLERARRPSS